MVVGDDSDDVGVGDDSDMMWRWKTNFNCVQTNVKITIETAHLSTKTYVLKRGFVLFGSTRELPMRKSEMYGYACTGIIMWINE